MGDNSEMPRFGPKQTLGFRGPAKYQSCQQEQGKYARYPDKEDGASWKTRIPEKLRKNGGRNGQSDGCNSVPSENLRRRVVGSGDYEDACESFRAE
jgi:hypothetical protein